MNKPSYSFDEFNMSSKLIRSFVSESDKISKFSGDFFNQSNILSRAASKVFSDEKREILVNALHRQNEEVNLSDATKGNIKRLSQKRTFTITTGHQLNMATGPLYTLYKILEIINWCEKLNESQSDTYFVPIFWMATEDHDFEEINHINLFGSKIEWKHESVENSVVGRIDTAKTEGFIDEVLKRFKDEGLNTKVKHFLSAYTKGGNLAMANRRLINELFGEFGLVIIDGDDKQLKKQFLPIAKSEIEKGHTYKCVSMVNEVLEKEGFHQQVFVRESNLFFIKENGERVRIEKADNQFLIGERVFEVEGLCDLLTEYPERFSPNALMRPLYQEAILPNIAYVGGGGEIAYWLQLKSTFETFKIPFPLLKVRASVILVDDRMKEVMTVAGYSLIDLKGDINEVLKDFVSKNQTVELSLADQKTSLDDIKSTVLQKALAIDKNATTFIEAEFQRMDNQLEKMEKKFIASEKKNQEKAVKQLKNLVFRLYPNGGLQERFDNYLSYIHIPDFVEILKQDLKARMTQTASIMVVDI